jgi:hypothetical protein
LKTELVDESEVQASPAAAHRSIERRMTMHEVNRKAELVAKEGCRFLHVRDVYYRLGAVYLGRRGVSLASAAQQQAPALAWLSQLRPFLIDFSPLRMDKCGACNIGAGGMAE